MAQFLLGLASAGQLIATKPKRTTGMHDIQTHAPRATNLKNSRCIRPGVPMHTSTGSIHCIGNCMPDMCARVWYCTSGTASAWVKPTAARTCMSFCIQQNSDNSRRGHKAHVGPDQELPMVHRLGGPDKEEENCLPASVMTRTPRPDPSTFQKVTNHL